VFTLEQIVEILLSPNLKHSGKSIRHNVVFIVNGTKVHDPTDVNRDDLGVWKNNRIDSILPIKDLS